MCIFSGRVDGVEGTQIFARVSNSGQQFLVYSMSYSADTELAMILPLPVPLKTGENAIRFIDLSDYETFFEDLNSGYPAEPEFRDAVSLGTSKEALKVHEVGSFVASFVPTLADFQRLDTCFRLPDAIWSQLPAYADYGFAVFQLKAGDKEVHPMAFEFPTRHPTELFFPTVHVHHGHVPTLGFFDHTIYCQMNTGVPNPSDSAWQPSYAPAKTFVDIQKAKDTVHPESVIYRKSMTGLHKNEDLLIGPA